MSEEPKILARVGRFFVSLTREQADKLKALRDDPILRAKPANARVVAEEDLLDSGQRETGQRVPEISKSLLLKDYEQKTL